ncbi:MULTISPECIES: glycosyltransferase family 4 protein [unclassified Limnobacter]|uniref:glycosyltransferase family 4 protein n=1 Tax=unclassified Limnobacter TaxID=2630203 RepID=UPI0025C671A3|nr:MULTISPECIES: glycosyltransferase family 4 protein [unclassified Limnobacter]
MRIRTGQVEAVLRILVAHNFYGSSAPSGENQVFLAEVAMLRSRGHEVLEFTRHSDEIRQKGALGTVIGGFSTPWNPSMVRQLNSVLKQYKPDIMHVHNTFPLLSPSIFHANGCKAAKVLTLHNYRLLCASGIPMRQGKTCTVCLDNQSSFPALQYGCYRNSRLATAPLALNIGLHRMLGTWQNNVDAFITLSNFQRELMARSGLPIQKLHIKPNFYPGMPSVIPWSERDDFIVFVGRLSAEKGITSLLDAWRKWGTSAPELRIVGDGELRSKLEALAFGLPVKFFGQLDSAEAQSLIAKSKLLVLPSECFEGFPMVVREAFAFGTPVAVSDLGPLPSIVTNNVNGVLFEPANSDSLLQSVQSAWHSESLLKKLGQFARQEFESKFTEDANYATLMEIYEQALSSGIGRKQ